MKMPNLASLYHSGTSYREREPQSGRNLPSCARRSTSAKMLLTLPSPKGENAVVVNQPVRAEPEERRAPMWDVQPSRSHGRDLRRASTREQEAALRWEKPPVPGCVRRRNTSAPE